MVNHDIDIAVFFSNLVNTSFKTNRVFDSGFFRHISDGFFKFTLILVFRFAASFRISAINWSELILAQSSFFE